MRKLALLLGLLAVAGVVVASEETTEVVTDSSAVVPYIGESATVLPEYPPAALAARFDGGVVLAAVVNADGTVGKIDVLDSLRPNLGFEQAAIAAMKQWRFEPARRNGEPVVSVAAFSLSFQVPDRGLGGGPIIGGQFLGAAIFTPSAPPLIDEPGRVMTSSYPHDGSVVKTDPVRGHNWLPKNYQQPRVCPRCMYDRRDYRPQPTRYRDTIEPQRP